MSGHSHAKKIKRQKAVTDQKRGQIFSKIARLISVAVKEGGPNPETNSKLGVAMEMAKKWNMPKENVERAIRSGSGEGTGDEKLESVSFEALGPQGIAIIIDGITDNKNRTLGEIKQILNQNNAKLVGEGAVRWLFEKRGIISLNLETQNPAFKNKEELELAAIEAGAQDFRWYDDDLEVYTRPEDLEKTRKILEEKGVKTEDSSLGWVAKEEIMADEKVQDACQKLFDDLDNNDAVQDVYSNIKLST